MLQAAGIVDITKRLRHVTSVIVAFIRRKQCGRKIGKNNRAIALRACTNSSKRGIRPSGEFPVRSPFAALPYALNRYSFVLMHSNNEERSVFLKRNIKILNNLQFTLKYHSFNSFIARQSKQKGFKNGKICSKF